VRAQFVAAAGQKIGLHPVHALHFPVAFLQFGGGAFELNGALRQLGLRPPARGDVEFDAIPDRRAIRIAGGRRAQQRPADFAGYAMGVAHLHFELLQPLARRCDGGVQPLDLRGSLCTHRENPA
jgi:hypothetical protein